MSSRPQDRTHIGYTVLMNQEDEDRKMVPPADSDNVQLITEPRITSDSDELPSDHNLNKSMTTPWMHRSKYKPVDIFPSLTSSSSFLGMKVISALFYGVTSLLIVMVNKVVLTSYQFPSAHFLGMGQMIATIGILSTGRCLNIISFPAFNRSTFHDIMPLPLFYAGNLLFGLGGTQRLSLPMFTVIRRFTILMTVIAEYYVLGITQSGTILATVVAMVGGAIVAAIDDLSFDMTGYILVMSNDVCTAANGVYLKKKLHGSHPLGKYGLLFYNSLFMLVPLMLLTYGEGDVSRVMSFAHWNNMSFIISFSSSCFMGFLLMYSTVLCTSHNSALTTTIIGCLKNILVTYVGMYIGGDYIFSFTNFLGLNISMVGSLVYSYVTFRSK